MASRILIIDDNEALVRGLTRTLSRYYEVESALSAEEALDILALSNYHLLLVDLAMPGMTGLDLLRQIRADGRDEAVIMMSGTGTIEAAVEAVKLGAGDFIEKPVQPERLMVTIRNQLRLGRYTAAHERLLSERITEGTMIGTSPAMENVRRLIAKVAGTEGRVLITGENGTGKELIASAIHEQSRRATGPFVKLNCSAVPKELIESELFGHERGAFTRAHEQRKGRFELADKGTLFLDEVGDMPLDMQVKLLRVLQDGDFERVGGSETLTADARVISATNKDLSQMIADGEFREDLYYRLNVFPIHAPPLRDRLGDVPALASHFAARAGERNRGLPIEITPGGLEALQGHDYPGNVRQLQNIVERLTIMIEGDVIDTPDTRMALPQRTESRPEHEPTARNAFAAGVTEADLERQRIVEALQRAGGRKGEAAKYLKVSRSTLWRRMQALGITPT